jgi:hypothetical protein
MPNRLLPSVLLLGGCFTADLDPNVEGAFACEVDDDCPEGQACDGSRCVVSENVPVLQVLMPEPDQVFAFDTFPVNGALQVNIQGNLTLAPPSDDNAPGTGFVELTVDGNTQRITSGPLSGVLEVMTTIERRPGPHRIAVTAFRTDGVPYGGAQSTVTSLFWLDDGDPAVALTRPWPGTEFPLGTPMIEVEVATLNFTMRSARMQNAEEIGHAHVHYDDEFPECAENQSCDSGYLAIVSPPGSEESDRASATIVLPESAATMSSLTAVLRNDDHTPYRDPFGDPTGRVIFDTIPIVRVAE